MKFEVKRIAGGRISVAEFNNGYSHIIADDNCWVIVNGGGISAWIFEEAKQVLDKLPNKPTDYKPFMDFITKD